MRQYIFLLTFFLTGFLLTGIYPSTIRAQIYEPEGLSMPGAWNEWTNPPVNNLALASSTQVPDGRVIKINTGIPRWQTIFSVNESGADLVGGTYDFLFTSGPEGNPFANKWAGVTIDENTLQNYSYQGADDNNVTLTNGYWYTMNWEDSGYEDTRAIFMQTSEEPVDILTVSVPTGIQPNAIATIDLTVSSMASPEELIYVRYSTDGWNSSAIVEADIAGTTGTANIPGYSEGTVVSYYAFSTTVPDITADHDLYTIILNNNAGENYSYTVEGTPQPEISWANLQWPPNGEIAPGNEFTVYAQVYAAGITDEEEQGTGITAWIGFSLTDTDPATWTNWMAASYNGGEASNDEYLANIGTQLTDEGTYYYASRFKLNDGDFVYGGYSVDGGGFWNGTTNVSGVLTVTNEITPAEISWANLQWPPSGEINTNEEFTVYGRVYIEGHTGNNNPPDLLSAWIGFSLQDTDPAEWTNWVPASFFGSIEGNDEFKGDIGASINTTGTYYYATRFKMGDGNYVYGGYSETGGGYWDGVDNVSGVLTVSEGTSDPVIGWANLQWPPDGVIEPGEEFITYAQAWIENTTGSGTATAGLQSWIGWSDEDSDPAGWTNWIAADFGQAVGNNDEFMTNLGAALTEEGTYYYASRFQYLDQDFVYGGYAEGGGGFWDGENYVSGQLIVVNEVVSYPVTFTVTDATGLYSNIKLKGEMTNWETIAMQQNGNEWTLTPDILPGSYEWGVIEDDGTPDGIWLIEGPNLEVNIAPDGTITGDTTYVITYVSLAEIKPAYSLYPNPAQNHLRLNGLDAPTDYQIKDLSGQIVKDGTITPGESISLSELAAGIFVLEIRQTDNIQQLKFIKQ